MLKLGTGSEFSCDMQAPLVGTLVVRLRSHPSEIPLEIICEETFDPSGWTGRQVANLALKALNDVEPGLEYAVIVTEKDTCWGADLSGVEVVLDITSRIADIGGVAAFVDMIRRALKDRRVDGDTSKEEG